MPPDLSAIKARWEALPPSIKLDRPEVPALLDHIADLTSRLLEGEGHVDNLLTIMAWVTALEAQKRPDEYAAAQAWLDAGKQKTQEQT